MAHVSLQNVVKSYGNKFKVVKGINLEIKDKEFVVLIGPSGCGKTTTLRMIAGLETISSGEISIGDTVVNDLPARERDIAMVFQNYSLYPHLTVFENIAFGLRVRKHKKDDIEQRVAKAASILGIEDYLQRKPKELSGGQRQRVAMGRAIVRDPQVFLFDEPLSNLDAKLRTQMRTEIKRIHQSVHATTIYVTHDQVEAMTLADRIVMMNHGEIEQIGTPDDLYHRPASRFVAGFIGSPQMNFFEGTLVSAQGGLGVDLGAGILLKIPQASQSRYEAHVNKKVVFGIRPENLELVPQAQGSSSTIVAELEVIEPLGADTLVYFRLGGALSCVRVEPNTALKAGEIVHFAPDMSKMHLFDAETGVTI